MKMRNYIARLLALLTAKQHLYQTSNLHSKQITSLEFLQHGAREARPHLGVQGQAMQKAVTLYMEQR